jgi:hypothetical protein
MEEFKITEEMKKYISLQRTGIKSNFEKRYFKEINYHWETIKEKCQSINSVLDIGCGIGGIDYFIAKNNTNCQINLLDKTKIENEVYYGFKEKGAFYNNLDISEKFLRINGITNNINLYTPESDFSNLKNVDLIISLISWGFHYPVDSYIDLVSSITRSSSSIIIDVRKSHIDDSINKFKEIDFELSEEIFEFEKCKRLLFIKL